MDYHSLPRKELQALCKKHGFRANTTNAAMADALQSLNIAQDSETEIRICDAMVLGNAGLNSPASVTTSCRRTPFRTSTRSMVRTSRAKRESEKAEEEEPISPAAGVIENLKEEASRSVIPSGRRITTRSSARKQMMEKVELAEELITPAKAVATLVPNSRRTIKVSAPQKTLQEGAVQPEVEGKKEALEKLKTPSFSSMICTRRSSRLRGKNQDSEANHLEQNLEKKFIDENGTKQPDAAAGPDQAEDMLCEPSVTIQETHAPVSGEHKAEPSGKTMTEDMTINETTCLLNQSDRGDGAVVECLIDAGVPLCADEDANDIPPTTESPVASSELPDLSPQPEGPAAAADKVVIDYISASSSFDSDLSFINGEECPSLTDAHGELPPSEADQVAVTSHEAPIGAVMLSPEVSDRAPLVDQTTGTLADLEPENNYGFAQEASHNPVEPENNISEPLSSVKDTDNIPAIDEVLQFPMAALTSHNASIVLPVKASDEAQVVSQTTEGVANLGKEKLHQADALEAGDGFIAQVASLGHVQALPSEPENDIEVLLSGFNCDNISLNAVLPSEPEKNVDEDLFSGISSDDVPATNEEVLQFAMEAQEVPSAGDGFIAQEATLNPVHLLQPSEPENNVGEILFSGINCDNVPATDEEVFHVPGTASLETQEVPSAEIHHGTCAVSFPDEFSGDIQQFEEVNEKSPSLGSWSTCPLPASLAVASPGPEPFMVPAADKSLQFLGVAPKGAQEAHAENTCYESLPIDPIPTVREEVSGGFQKIEGANEKSPSFGSWSAKSPCSEFSMVRKSGKSRSSIGSSRGKTLARIRMFTTVEACVDKENKSMTEENIVVDKMNEKIGGLVEFENYSLRKLRSLVKDGIKNKVHMNERTPLEILSANCLLGNENRETE